MPRKDEAKKSTAQAGSVVSNEGTLAAINSHKDDLFKDYVLLDSLRKSLKGRLASFEARLITLQTEHREIQQRLDSTDGVLEFNNY